MQQPRGFREWVKRVARDLSVRRDELAEGAAGSFSEAAAYLTSPRVLGPKDGGLPGAYEVAGEEEHVVLAIYSAAFVSADGYSGTVDVLYATDHPLEDSFVDVVVVAWGRPEGEDGRETARVIALRRNVPLTSFACRSVGDLEGLYGFVRSSKHED